jgi:hypothetical protein
MTWALVSVIGLLLALLAPSLVWLHAEISEGKHLRDRLDEQTRLSSEYQHERDVVVAAHAVTSTQLKEASERVTVVEAQRNELMRERADRLKESDAQTVADVLDSTLAKPWRAVHGVPQVPAAGHSSAADDLIDPAKL